MKKLVSLILAILLMASLIACGAKPESEEPAEKKGPTLYLPDIYVQEVEARVPESVIPHDAHYVDNLEAYAIEIAGKGDLETGFYIISINELVFFVSVRDRVVTDISHTDKID